jgi:hypothetical protein
MAHEELIGTIIGKSSAYLVKGIFYSRLAEVVSPQGVMAMKIGATYGLRLLEFTSANYARQDFSPQTIFNEAIDASFFSD